MFFFVYEIVLNAEKKITGVPKLKPTVVFHVTELSSFISVGISGKSVALKFWFISFT